MGLSILPQSQKGRGCSRPYQEMSWIPQTAHPYTLEGRLYVRFPGLSKAPRCEFALMACQCRLHPLGVSIVEAGCKSRSQETAKATRRDHFNMVQIVTGAATTAPRGFCFARLSSFTNRLHMVPLKQQTLTCGVIHTLSPLYEFTAGGASPCDS